MIGESNLEATALMRKYCNRITQRRIQPSNQLIQQSCTELINQSISQWIIQSISQSINQSSNQTIKINHKIKQRAVKNSCFNQSRKLSRCQNDSSKQCFNLFLQCQIGVACRMSKSASLLHHTNCDAAAFVFWALRAASVFCKAGCLARAIRVAWSTDAQLRL